MKNHYCYFLLKIILIFKTNFCSDQEEKEMVIEPVISSAAGLKSEPTCERSLQIKSSESDRSMSIITNLPPTTQTISLQQIESPPSIITFVRDCKPEIQNLTLQKPISTIESLPMTPVNHVNMNQEDTLRNSLPEQEVNSLIIECGTKNQNVVFQSFIPKLEITTISLEGSSVETLPAKNVIELVKKDVIELVKKDVDDSDDNNMFKQKIPFVHPPDRELTGLLEPFGSAISKVTKFYGYFDVLTFIDKSLALIPKFIFITNTNLKENLTIRHKKIEKIHFEIESVKILFEDVKALFVKKEGQLKQLCEEKDINNKLSNVKNCLECAEKQFDRFKSKDYEINYFKYDSMKSEKLDNLKKELENLRKKILPMKEEDIEKHDKLLKEPLFTVIFKVYENLISCYKKEQTSLNWLFEVFDGILDDIEKCKNKLESYKRILN